MPTLESPVAAGDELVVLVHGTYANSKSDQGDGWWQTGSKVWANLGKCLPRGVRLPRVGEVFHWSGENSERARIKAAQGLLAHLQKLESQGRKYHLIGHSHGGSVIWHALRLATLQRQKLGRLVSWATVGTPFLIHRTRGALNVINVFNLILAIILIKPAYRTIKALTMIVMGASFDSINTSQGGEAATITWLKSPVLKALDTFGFAVSATTQRVRIGSFDSTSGESFQHYLFMTAEGWLVLIVALLTIYVFLNLCGFFLGPVLESRRIRSERRLDRSVMDNFKSRWLGIWSTDDEAINGLRMTLNMSLSLVPAMAPQERILFSDRLSVLSRPYHWVLTPFFNALVRPFLNGLVQNFVVKAAQGNNRPAAEVIEVSTSPIQHEASDQFPSLPEWLNETIVNAANANISDAAPNLRRLLAAPSFVNGLEQFGHSISGRELVHTSYFDHIPILNLLSRHIAASRGDANWQETSEDTQEELVQWLREYRRLAGADPESRFAPPPRGLVRPRRLKRSAA